MKHPTRRLSRAPTLSLLLLLLLAAVGGRCGKTSVHVLLFGPDPMLAGDWYSTLTGMYDELVPGAPLMNPGPDGTFGTADDFATPGIVGDTDLVLRTGITGFAGAIPDPSPLVAGGSEPVGVTGLFGLGTPIDFVVVASDGVSPPAHGTPVAPAYFEGLPILAVAFADLDADGFIGVTLLDGDPTDSVLEQRELEPVGRNFGFASGDRASGSLLVTAGGPAAAPLRVAIAALTVTGFTNPDFFGGNVPTGATVMTQLPFYPLTDTNQVFQGGLAGPPPAAPGELIGVKVKATAPPNPADPAQGESFTLRTDGSSSSIDVAVMRSGPFARFGLARLPDPALYRPLDLRPLRPGLDDLGAPALYEVLQRYGLADDGAASTATLRVVPLDRLGNITDPAAPSSVTIQVGSGMRIVSPDLDGLPNLETVLVSDAAGVEIVLDDIAGAFDNANLDAIRVEGGGGLYRLDVFLPDPDVDNSGVVDILDRNAVAAVAAFEPEDGEPGFDGNLDLDRNGIIDLFDIAIVDANDGASIPVP